MIDVAVIGGGVAGMSAALQLGRARQQTCIFDTSEQRNRKVAHSHGWLTRDGASPAELYQIARQELSQYPSVELVAKRIVKITPQGPHWHLEVEDGSSLQARRVVLTTGVRDELLPVEGLQERLAQEVQFCPYCHGFEWQDQPLAVLGWKPEFAWHQTIMLSSWTQDLTLWLHQTTLPEEQLIQLQQLGVKINPHPLQRVEPVDGGLLLTGEKGYTQWVQGLFTQPIKMHQTPLLEGLNVELTEMGFIKVNERQATNIPGLFAAGDLCTPMHTLSVASAAGAMAGVGAHQSMLFESLAKAEGSAFKPTP